jgi:hypothetical protein
MLVSLAKGSFRPPVPFQPLSLHKDCLVCPPLDRWAHRPVVNEGPPPALPVTADYTQSGFSAFIHHPWYTPEKHL